MESSVAPVHLSVFVARAEVVGVQVCGVVRWQWALGHGASERQVTTAALPPCSNLVFKEDFFCYLPIRPRQTYGRTESYRKFVLGMLNVKACFTQEVRDRSSAHCTTIGPLRTAMGGALNL